MVVREGVQVVVSAIIQSHFGELLSNCVDWVEERHGSTSCLSRAGGLRVLPLHEHILSNLHHNMSLVEVVIDLVNVEFHFVFVSGYGSSDEQ